MTVFHDDQLDESEINYSRRQTKKIPRWARSKSIAYELTLNNLNILF